MCTGLLIAVVISLPLISAPAATDVAGSDKNSDIDPGPCSDEVIEARNEGHETSRDPRSFEVIGVYSANRANRYGVSAPFDWKAIADRRISGFASTRPLTIEQRRRARELERAYREDTYTDTALYRFEARVSDVPPGPYYLIDLEGVSPAVLGRVTGQVHVSVDEEGCEYQRRSFSGQVHLANHPDRKLGGFLVRAHRPLQFITTRARAALKGEEVAVTALGGGAKKESWHVRAEREWLFKGTELRGAVVLRVQPSGERFLFIHASEYGNCDTNVALYILEGSSSPRLISRGCADCDV